MERGSAVLEAGSPLLFVVGEDGTGVWGSSVFSSVSDGTFSERLWGSLFFEVGVDGSLDLGLVALGCSVLRGEGSCLSGGDITGEIGRGEETLDWGEEGFVLREGEEEGEGLVMFFDDRPRRLEEKMANWL